MKKIKTAIAASLLLVGINEITKESTAASTLENATDIAVQQPSIVVGYVGNGFTDVSPSDSSNAAIYWAQQTGLISGYTDGSFRPNNSVTERQFAKILVNYFKLNSTSNLSNSSISETALHYNILAEYGIPLNGYNSVQLQNMAVKRGVVAQAIAYLANGSNNVEESIQYLLQNNITTGQNQAYQNIDLHQYFGSENSLTRKQLVTFFYRMNNANIVNISAVALDTYKANTPSQGAVSNPTTTTTQPVVSKPTTTTTTSNQLISRDKAIAIAQQKFSGTVTKIELDYDYGMPVYEIEIRNGYNECDIDINATTGAILKFQPEYKNVSTQTTVSKPTTTTTTTSNQLISRDKAISIAKQRASGTVIKAELDYDDGMAVYEIEIRNGYMEYDIKINARTGAILKFESDYDD